MFEVVEVGQSVSKEEYDARLPWLRTELVRLQHQLKSANFSVIVILEGMEGAGRSETLQLLHGWMDPRFLGTWAWGKPSEEEKERPYFWRFWRALPPHGRIGFFLGSWYTWPLRQRFMGRIDDAEMERSLRHINTLEQGLVENSTLLLKFWFHLSPDAQKKRIKKLTADPATRWRVAPLDQKLVKHYCPYRQAAEAALRLTSTAETPWTLLDCTDDRHRNLAVGEKIAAAIGARLHEKPAGAVFTSLPNTQVPTTGPRRSILDQLDLRQRLGKEEYDRKLPKYEEQLHVLSRQAARQGVTSVIVFEGWDAAGKGSLVRRLVAALDPRDFRIVPIAAPTDEEKAHHYFWRFWRHLPRQGKVTIFDRSWYGRVLVERVEGFATEAEWSRAYQEINDFEQHLSEHGILLLKYWLHIDKEEQLRRFREREATPYKQFKISAEDWRNREKWDAYEVAVQDMVARCGTDFAPWTLVEANDKRFARIKVLKHVCKQLQQRLG